MFKSDFLIYSTWSKEGFTYFTDLLYACVKHYYSFIMPEKCQKFKRRSYSSIHAFSWAINLERFGYTNCMFRNCQFMALDIDAIATHHFECPGGGSNDLLFMCSVCKRGTADEYTLNNHYFLSHPEEAKTRGISTVNYNKTIPKIISNVRKKSWELFLERKGYIKCLIHNCQFITDELVVIEEHYKTCCKGIQSGEMNYVCTTCCGITSNKEFFERHCSICVRKNVLTPPSDSFKPKPEVTLAIANSWSDNIRKFKAAKCPKDGCKFIDNNIRTLQRHFLKCKSTLDDMLVVCHICGGWLSNTKKLDEHLNSVHKPEEAIPNVCLVLQENDCENNFEYQVGPHTQLNETNDELSVYSSGDEEDADCRESTPCAEDISDISEQKESPFAASNTAGPNIPLKTYERVIKKQKEIPSIEVVIPGKTRKIDYIKTKPSSVQYGEHFLDKNLPLLAEVNVGSCKSGKRTYRSDDQEVHSPQPDTDNAGTLEGRYFAPLGINGLPKSRNNNVAGDNSGSNQENTDLTPLAKIAKKLMKENEDMAIPVNISVEDKSWTVSVASSVFAGPKLTGNIIDDFNAIGQYMRREANNLLKCARTKNTVLNKQLYHKKYPTRVRTPAALPPIDLISMVTESDVSTKYDNLFTECLEKDPQIRPKSKGELGIPNNGNKIQSNQKNLTTGEVLGEQSCSVRENATIQSYNEVSTSNKHHLLNDRHILNKTINPSSSKREDQAVHSEDCNEIADSHDGSDCESLQMEVEHVEEEDEEEEEEEEENFHTDPSNHFMINASEHLCTTVLGGKETGSKANTSAVSSVNVSNPKNNKSFITVKGMPIVFDEQEMEIIPLNPKTSVDQSKISHNSLMNQNEGSDKIEIMEIDTIEKDAEEGSSEDNKLETISDINERIDKDELRNGENVQKTELESNNVKKISEVGSAPPIISTSVILSTALKTCSGSQSECESTRNDIPSQKTSESGEVGDPNNRYSGQVEVKIGDSEEVPLSSNANKSMDKSKLSHNPNNNDRNDVEGFHSSSSDSNCSLAELSAKFFKKEFNEKSKTPQFVLENDFSCLKKTGQTRKKLKRKKSEGKKINDFLGFSDDSVSCNKLNHLLSYCNMLGIIAELQTYPIHVKFDVTPKKSSPGNSSPLDTKANNNKDKKESSSGEEKAQQSPQGLSSKNQNPDNPGNSKKKKAERKSSRTQKSGVNKPDSNNDDPVDEYQTFVGTLGETSTPHINRNVDNTNISDRAEESSMTTRSSGSENTIKKKEISSKKISDDGSSKDEVSQDSFLSKEESEKEANYGETELINNKNLKQDKSHCDTSLQSNQNASESVESEDGNPSRKKPRVSRGNASTISNDSAAENSVNEENISRSPKSNVAEDLAKTNYSNNDKNDESKTVNSACLPEISSSKDNPGDDCSSNNVNTALNTNTPSNPENEDTPVVKRKRGRPRKIQVVDETKIESSVSLQRDLFNESVSEDFSSLEHNQTSRQHILRSHLNDSASSQIKEDGDISPSESTNPEGCYDVGYLPPSAPPVKRRPGRPRKNQPPPDPNESGESNSEFHDDTDSELGQRTGRGCRPSTRGRRNPFLGVRYSSDVKEEDPDRVGTCVMCKESMTVGDFQKKHMVLHNFICWLDGDEPLDTNCENTMVNWLTRFKKKFPKHIFKCEKCSETKKSVKGFLSHLQFCGKTLEERQKLMVACPVCGRVMMPSSLEQHHPTCVRKVPGKEVPVVEGPLSPRKAARQCLDTIADIAPSLLDDGSSKKRKQRKISDELGEGASVDSDEDMLDENGEVSLDVLDAVRELYTLKTKRITRHLKTMWEMAVAEGKTITCPCPSCDFSTYVFLEMNDHYRTCPHDFQGYVCKDCKYTSNSEKDMMRHVKRVHIDHLHSLKTSDKSHSSKREDATGSGSSYIPFLKKAEIAFNPNAKQAKFFRPAVWWTQEQRNVNYTSEPIFLDYKFSPELWQELKSDDIETYLPEKKLSIKFSSKKKSDWDQLKLFDSKFLNDDLCVMFTGGPVWGLAWAPGNSDVQYLAVSTHLSMHSSFRMGSAHTSPGVVQIWSLKGLNNISNLSQSEVKMEYVFCHDFGGCWALEWCPAGCQDNSRIGLLAIATTSGIIPVFAVPCPQALSTNGTFAETKHYKPEPSLLLKLCSYVNCQCTRLSWSKVKPHRSLVAGFTNGVIGIWDLNSQSVLLRSGATLYPYKTFNAHHSNITGLCMSPASESYLVSAALDKTVKFWDLNNTGAPQCVHRRGLVNDVTWMQHWLCAVAVYDESYLSGQTTVALHSIRDYVYQPLSFISNVKSSAWCVSVSDWLNAIATSYDNGQISVAFAKQHDPSGEKRDEKRKVLKVILQTSLFDFEKNAPISSHDLSEISTSSSMDKSSNVSRSFTEKPSTSSAVEQCEPRTVNCCTFEEVSEKCGIQFNSDIDFKNECDLQGNQPNPIDIYPLMSANKVTWNPNMKALLSLAVGYQSGFVVIPKLTLPIFDQKFVESFVKSSLQTSQN